MKLEDIDGDVYITDSLLEALKSSEPERPTFTKYTVTTGETPIGLLKSFKSSPPILELEFETAIDPGRLISELAGRPVSVAGMNFGLEYVVGEVSCNVETLRCSVKAIHIEEVQDDRREPDVRV